MRKTILTAIITALIGHISANAAEKTATWRISETGASRSGDSFNNEKTGDIQRIVLQPAGKVRAILSASVSNFSKSVHWKNDGNHLIFLNTVQKPDIPGEHSSKFFGQYQIGAPTGGAGNANATPPTWSFIDKLTIQTNYKETTVVSTDSTNDIDTFLFTINPTPVFIVHSGNTYKEVVPSDAPDAEYGHCAYSLNYDSKDIEIAEIPNSMRRDVTHDGVTYAYVIGCHCSKISGQIIVTYTMPKWGQYNSATKDDQLMWDNFYNALFAHEQEHADICRLATQKYREALQNIRVDGYARTQRRAAALAKDAVQELCAITYVRFASALNTFQNEYDKITNHGREQSKWNEAIKSQLLTKLANELQN